MKIVVNTPAGNIGRNVVKHLLLKGEEVVIISRNAGKVTDLVNQGAKLVVGSIDDPAVLLKAFNNVESLFWVTPFAPDRPDYINWARQLARTAADAARTAGVSRVVLVSSVGAQHESGVGPIGCCLAIETAFRNAVPDVTALRAGSFMENYLASVGTIASSGMIFGSHPADLKISRVATCDIAQKAFEALTVRSRRGFRIVGVHGPEDLTPSRAAEIIGEAIGRQVTYVEVSVEMARKGMLEAGLPEFMADLLAEMYTGFREGRMERAEPRTEETTTETSLFEFSRNVLKPAIELASSPVAVPELTQ
jgi:uncharacterized protein YbjT (DUF2867 family)